MEHGMLVPDLFSSTHRGMKRSPMTSIDLLSGSIRHLRQFHSETKETLKITENDWSQWSNQGSKC